MTTEFDELVRIAVTATEEGRFDDAERSLVQASQLDPASAVPHFLLGANFAQVKQNDLAEASFIACLARAPGLAIARFQLGLLQLTNGRAAAAQATWEPLLASPERGFLECFTRGFVAILGGDKAGAQELIEEGIRLNVENPTLNKDMLGVLARLENVEEVASSTKRMERSAEGTVATSQAEESSAHFLLSTYGQH